MTAAMTPTRSTQARMEFGAFRIMLPHFDSEDPVRLTDALIKSNKSIVDRATAALDGEN
jgi:hypothetical protein